MFHWGTYPHRIAKYTTDLRREEVERSIHVALNMWSGAADLDFIKVDHGEADIVISFETKGRFENTEYTWVRIDILTR